MMVVYAVHAIHIMNKCPQGGWPIVGVGGGVQSRDTHRHCSNIAVDNVPPPVLVAAFPCRTVLPCRQEHCAAQAADGDSGGRGPLDGPSPIPSEHTVNEGQGQITVPLSALQREQEAQARGRWLESD